MPPTDLDREYIWISDSDPPRSSDLRTQSPFSSSLGELVQESNTQPLDIQLVAADSHGLSDAFELMVNKLHDTPNLNDRLIAGVVVADRDVVSLPSPNWYTDAVIDAVAYVALQNCPNPRIIHYQHVVMILPYT